MCCANDRTETIQDDESTESMRQQDASCCPCGHCPKNAKWVCMAVLGAALGVVAFRAFRRATAS